MTRTRDLAEKQDMLQRGVEENVAYRRIERELETGRAASAEVAREAAALGDARQVTRRQQTAGSNRQKLSEEKAGNAGRIASHDEQVGRCGSAARCFLLVSSSSFSLFRARPVSG